MTSRLLQQAPEPALAAELAKFEQAFTYALGPARRFFISHGEDYPRFFRAIGPAATLLVQHRDGQVLGTLGMAARPLKFPNGEVRRVAYLGDLKIAPGMMRGLVLLRLAQLASQHWSTIEETVAGYGVVMDGTSALPALYTGRHGLPAFRELAQIEILRLPTGTNARIDPAFASGEAVVHEQFTRLSAGAFMPMAGRPEIRSPLGLVSPDGRACGLLEDTRLAKRLFTLDGEEMRSAHLSRFAYAHPLAGVSLIRQALAHCAASQWAPALFVAVPRRDRPDFLALLADLPGIVTAGATVYGTGLDASGEPWHIATAEI